MNLLIENVNVVPMDGTDVKTHHSIYVEGSTIKAVLPKDEIPMEYKKNADRTIGAPGQIVIPGLIDAHQHVGADRLAEAFILEMDLPTLLVKYKWPLLCNVSPAEIRTGAELAFIESIRSGVTSLIANYYAGRGINQEGVALAAEATGIRVRLARGYHDYPYRVPDELLETPETIYHMYEQMLDKWHHKANDRIQVSIAPVNLVYADPANLPQLADLARQHQTGFHTHVAEVEWVSDTLKKRTGKTYVELLDESGALGPYSQAAHGVYLSENDIQRLAATQTTVVHNPVSNMIFASGICDISQLSDGGVNVALGTDGNEHMFAAMRQTAYLRKVITRDPLAFTAEKSLSHATRHGATAMGPTSKQGQIRPGYLADLVLLSPQTADVLPYVDLYNVIVYMLNPSHVDTVIIDGELVLEQGQFNTINEDKTLRDAQKIQDHVFPRYYP